MVVAKVRQRVDFGIDVQDDAAAVAAIAAGWPAEGHKFFPPKGDAAIAMSLEDALALRRKDPDGYIERAMQSMAVHVEAMLALQKKGAITFDYGNNIRAQAQKAGIKNAFDIPGFVPEYIRPLFCEGRGPFRWVALSGDPADIARTDKLALELFPKNRTLARWMKLAKERIHYQGLPARICWLGYGERAEFGVAINELVKSGEIKAPIVSDETTVTGEKPAELPVVNETTFKIGRRTEAFLPGEKAALTIEAPFGGVAWVSVETDEVLDTLLVPVKGNAGRIELPIKENYAPNAAVSIYLVKPGGEKELPLERFAYTEIDVRRADRELKIAPHLASATAKPGEIVRGEILVTSQDKPVPDADLLVFAMKPEEGHPDRFPVLGIRRSACCSGRIGPFESREENILFFLQVGRHIGCYLVKDGGDPDHLGMVSPMNSGDLSGIGSDLLVILLEIDMMGIDDIIGEKRQRPR